MVSCSYFKLNNKYSRFSDFFGIFDGEWSCLHFSKDPRMKSRWVETPFVIHGWESLQTQDFFKCRLARKKFGLVWFQIAVRMESWAFEITLLFFLMCGLTLCFQMPMQWIWFLLDCPGHDSWHKKGRTLAVMVTDEHKFFNSLIYCTEANEDWLMNFYTVWRIVFFCHNAHQPKQTHILLFHSASDRWSVAKLRKPKETWLCRNCYKQCDPPPGVWTWKS